MRSHPNMGPCQREQRRQGQARCDRSGREALALATCGEDPDGPDVDERSPALQTVLGQRLEQRPSLLEIGGVEALRKPAVDRG